jgi:hypothetical protein
MCQFNSGCPGFESDDGFFPCTIETGCASGLTVTRRVYPLASDGSDTIGYTSEGTPAQWAGVMTEYSEVDPGSFLISEVGDVYSDGREVWTLRRMHGRLTWVALDGSYTPPAIFVKS